VGLFVYARVFQDYSPAYTHMHRTACNALYIFSTDYAF
jgi:hypothetical protein